MLGAAAVHAGLLAGLLLSRAALRLPTARLAPDLQLDLDRPPLRTLPEKDRASQHSPKNGAPKPAVPAAAASRSASPIAAPAPAAVPAAAAPEGRAAISDAWRVGSAAEPLRALGVDCSRLASRTTAEQAACARATAQARATELPKIDALPAVKRGYYDAVVEKKDYDRNGAFKDMAKMQQARGMAGERTHFDLTVGYHCSFKFGPGAAEENKAAGNKIGFPPCPLHAPGAEPAPP